MNFNYQTITTLAKGAIANAIPQYELVLLENLRAIVDRYEADPDYHFIDTKLNIITGDDLYPASKDEPFKDKDVIYSWIQGRGIEALTGHARWLESCSIISEPEKQQLITRIKKQLGQVVAAMEHCRTVNGGQLFFWMRPDGKMLTLDADNNLVKADMIPPQSNYSDLFYAKGLLAAAKYLEWSDKAAEAEIYLKKVIEDIQKDNFLSDQQPFDRKNRVTPVVGKHIQGPWMIALGGIALGIDYGEQEYWITKAEQFINHIINTHINSDGNGHCQLYDFWEAVDDNGKPWEEEDGTIICDPGHALEFIGLSLKCLLKISPVNTNLPNSHKSSLPESSYELQTKCRTLYPALLKHFFSLGFNPAAGGICKAYDLKSRRVINSDMPWWSLPETIRAAALLTKFSPQAETAAMWVICDASNAFMNGFINPKVHLMAWQTRDISGKPIAVIPATPDADPGYHTGLSIIDFITTWRKI